MPAGNESASIHARLQEWAHWRTLGGSGDGYPTKSVLHPSWMPPTPGTTPTPKVSTGGNARRQRDVDCAVGLLSRRMSDTVVVHYCMRLPVPEQALRLGCAESTVHARIRTAQRLVMQHLQQLQALKPLRRNA